MNPLMLLAVFAGGGAGALTRHFSFVWMSKMYGDAFPYGTLFVNVAGSFIIGAIIEIAALKWQISLETRAFIVTGFLGGFTTFSTFSLDVLKLVDTHQLTTALLYVTASVALSLLAVFASTHLLRALL